MLITIHQPNYMPWAGFFNKWMIADAFVVLDTVQYHKNEWQNRNRIKTAQGAKWITVPVTYRFPERVCEVGIAPGPWARKQVAMIEQAYAKAPHLDAYWPPIRALLMQPHEKIGELNIALIRLLGDMLGCTAPLHIASEMAVASDEQTGRLVEICRQLGGDGYLSGQEGRNYLDRDAFERAGIGLWFQQASAPHYPQLHGEFISHLSVIDMLFNVGSEAKELVRKTGVKGS